MRKTASVLFLDGPKTDEADILHMRDIIISYTNILEELSFCAYPDEQEAWQEAKDIYRSLLLSVDSKLIARLNNAPANSAPDTDQTRNDSDAEVPQADTPTTTDHDLQRCFRDALASSLDTAAPDATTTVLDATATDSEEQLALLKFKNGKWYGKGYGKGKKWSRLKYNNFVLPNFGIEDGGAFLKHCREHPRKGCPIPAGDARATEDRPRNNIAELALDHIEATVAQPCVDALEPVVEYQQGNASTCVSSAAASAITRQTQAQVDTG